MGTCKLPGCDKPMELKSVCRTHYMRKYRTGAYELSHKPRQSGWRPARDVVICELCGVSWDGSRRPGRTIPVCSECRKDTAAYGRVQYDLKAKLTPILECESCGEPWVYTAGGRYPRTCDDCRRCECDHCGEEFETDSTGVLTDGWGRFCSDECMRMGARKYYTCLECATQFRNDSGRKTNEYCSRPCANAANGRKRRRASEERKRKRNAARLRELARPRACMVCEDDYLPVSLNQKYCSVACRDERNRQRAYERWAPHRQGNSYTRRERTPATCVQCGESFLSDTGQRYCSSACYPRAGRTNRHLRYVIRRDAGRCQLCGERVDLSVTVPDPRAPTVDHIVPRSLGGRDTKRNVHLAHFGCNARKGAGAVGEQMLCIG